MFTLHYAHTYWSQSCFLGTFYHKKSSRMINHSLKASKELVILVVTVHRFSFDAFIVFILSMAFSFYSCIKRFPRIVFLKADFLDG